MLDRNVTVRLGYSDGLYVNWDNRAILAGVPPTERPFVVVTLVLDGNEVAKITAKYAHVAGPSHDLLRAKEVQFGKCIDCDGSQPGCEGHPNHPEVRIIVEARPRIGGREAVVHDPR